MTSQCYGIPSNGYLKDAVQLPSMGSNYYAYSNLGWIMGRTYVHSKVALTVQESYAKIARTHPRLQFIYAETGLKKGGKFSPHKTHQNGLSVDFMVPVIDQEKQPAVLPTMAANRFGYDIEFDHQGRYETLTIDFDAMALHLMQLHQSALNYGGNIKKVIFDPVLQKLLMQSAYAEYLQSNINFSKNRVWVRHDEHYHVDFDFPCQSLP